MSAPSTRFMDTEIPELAPGEARFHVLPVPYEKTVSYGHGTAQGPGAIIGALLPTSEHEGRYLGEMRDKTIKDVAQKSRVRLETALDAATRSASERDSAFDGSRGAAPRPH